MKQTAEKFLALLEIVARLRAPEGCPWDQKQTPQSFKHYLIEESHELIEAINDDEPDHIREELGDLLFQIIFLNNLYQEKGLFNLNEVIDGISKKMVRRHPHVFAKSDTGSEHDLRRQWQAIKDEENRGKSKPAHPMTSIPKSLPALHRAQGLADRAAREGFAWADLNGAMNKVKEELREFEEAIGSGKRQRIMEELGDILFALAVVARKVTVDGEEALQKAADRFTRRFLSLEQLAAQNGAKLNGLSQENLLALWRQAKKAQS